MKYQDAVREFKDALVDHRRDAVLAALRMAGRVTFSDAISRYVQSLAANRKRRGGENADGRNSHAANTATVLRKLARELGVTHLDEVTPETVESYIDRRTAEGLSGKTLRNHLASLSGLSSWALRFKYLGSNPVEAVRTPEVESGEIDFIEPDTIGKALAAVKGTSVERPVALALLAGLRRCEITRLSSGDIDWSRKEVVIRPAVSKTGRGRRVPMSDRLAEILRRKLTVPFVCTNRDGQKWNPDRLTRRARYFLRSIRSNVGGKVGFNTLRHTFVTSLLAKGTEVWTVAKWAGHSVQVLERHYGAYVKPEGAEGTVDILAV